LANAGTLRSVDDLGLSPAALARLRVAGEASQGLLLVTGPAGSGKSTTLHALLRHLRDTRPGMSMITLEDPVELRLDGVPQIQIAPHGELTYARALRSILRQDPQVVLLGEIRDAETAGIAIEAALTGHLILSTMHGGRAVGALVRLLDMGIPPYQLTSTLNLVVCQRLVRTLCKRCTRPDDEAGPDAIIVAKGDCEDCFGSRFRGRTACAEFIEMSAALRRAILAQADAHELAKAVESDESFIPLNVDARRHVDAGRTTADEIGGLTVGSSTLS
jgi:general secretion pathway protein E